VTTAFEQLDFLYTPSRDVAGDLEQFVELGAEVLFAIEGMGTRVAAVRLADHSPLVILADHLDGVRPILVFRVSDLEAERTRVESLGWVAGLSLEIPHGPCWSFATPGGHRIAVYELTRRGVAEHFEGRRDF
jgi:hypothetical protein